MCLGSPALVLEVDDDGQTALVDEDGTRQTVALTAITFGGQRVAPGDWLLLLTGLAVERLDEREAREILDVQAQVRQGTA